MATRSPRRPPQRRRIDLALQGGGSHGAFTWGVLDRLLEEEWLEIAGVSGTSAGAMNAVALAAGLLEGGRVGALVVLSLSLEVPLGQTEAVHAREPRLRDEFLRVLFDHANSGGFRGTFTDSANLVLLRRALLEAAQKAMGDSITDVLITDIVRQDS